MFFFRQETSDNLPSYFSNPKLYTTFTNSNEYHFIRQPILASLQYWRITIYMTIKIKCNIIILLIWVFKSNDCKDVFCHWSLKEDWDVSLSLGRVVEAIRRLSRTTINATSLIVLTLSFSSWRGFGNHHQCHFLYCSNTFTFIMRRFWEPPSMPLSLLF